MAVGSLEVTLYLRCLDARICTLLQIDTTAAPQHTFGIGGGDTAAATDMMGSIVAWVGGVNANVIVQCLLLCATIHLGTLELAVTGAERSSRERSNVVDRDRRGRSRSPAVLCNHEVVKALPALRVDAVVPAASPVGSASRVVLKLTTASSTAAAMEPFTLLLANGTPVFELGGCCRKDDCPRLEARVVTANQACSCSSPTYVCLAIGMAASPTLQHRGGVLHASAVEFAASAPCHAVEVIFFTCHTMGEGHSARVFI